MKKLIFKELTITRAEGVGVSDHLVYEGEHGFGPEVNLIVGPNGAGKSTTAQSLQTVLFGDSTGRRIDANYTLLVDDDAIAGSTIGPQDPKLAECVPADQNGKVFVLSLEDLVKVGQQDAATSIKEEVFGGVTFDVLAKRAGFEARSQSKKYAIARNVAERRKSEVGREHGEYPRLEARLAEIRTELDDLRKTSRLARCVEAWSELKQAQTDAEASRSRTAEFDARIVNLQDEDSDRIDKLHLTIRDLERHLSQASSKLDRGMEAFTAKYLLVTNIVRVVVEVREE